uniref:Uncharacterized protein n=1 Tax=Utricularia reniformis TaxID=192314 RepID=A0A1Y0B0T5_9LAMI|nr:hypothetical protein AEK19_MT0744 [Utricularia reniformis]ART30988.1 hypothetical protein AEK19_MT0744 [Utricularia reniformis]
MQMAFESSSYLSKKETTPASNDRNTADSVSRHLLRRSVR